MRRGAVLAGVVYAILAIAVRVVSPLPEPLIVAALVVGLPGAALLGAGLTPAAAGSRPEAMVAGLAFALGIPVAAVTSLLIGAFVLGVVGDAAVDLTAPILRSGVSQAVAVAPAVGLAALAWTVGVRRVSRGR